MDGKPYWMLSRQKNIQDKIDAFELRCWRKLLRVPWIARRSNQSILKEISPEYSLEGLVLKLKLQYFDHLMQRIDSLEKTLLLGKIEGRRRRGQQGWDGWMASPTQWTWVWVNSGSWGWIGRPGVLQSMESQRVGHNRATELNWTERLFLSFLKFYLFIFCCPGSSLLCAGFLWLRWFFLWFLWCAGISLRWLLLLRFTGPRVHRLR